MSRQTLYNRWETVADIVLDALTHRAGREIVGLDEDTQQRSLRVYLDEFATAVNGWARPALRAVAALAQHDDRFAMRFREDFIRVRHNRLLDAVTDAGLTIEPVTAAEGIAGSMWFRLLITDQQLDAAWMNSMCDLVGAP